MRVSEDTLRSHVWKFQPREFVRHRSGGIYRIVACAFTESNVGPVYVYERDGVTWTRPQSEFEDGRFVLIDYA